MHSLDNTTRRRNSTLNSRWAIYTGRTGALPTQSRWNLENRELAAIFEFLRPGDELVVAKLDRIGHSTRDVLNLVHEAEKRGAGLRVLEPEFSTSNDAGRMLVTVLGMVGEPERRFILERQATGIAKAKANGVYRGRKPSIDRAAVRELRA